MEISSLKAPTVGMYVQLCVCACDGGGGGGGEWQIKVMLCVCYATYTEQPGSWYNTFNPTKKWNCIRFNLYIFPVVCLLFCCN